MGNIVTGVPDPGYAAFPVSYDQLSPAFISCFQFCGFPGLFLVRAMAFATSFPLRLCLCLCLRSCPHSQPQPHEVDQIRPDQTRQEQGAHCMRTNLILLHLNLLSGYGCILTTQADTFSTDTGVASASIVASPPHRCDFVAKI